LRSTPKSLRVVASLNSRVSFSKYTIVALLTPTRLATSAMVKPDSSRINRAIWPSVGFWGMAFSPHRPFIPQVRIKRYRNKEFDTNQFARYYLIRRGQHEPTTFSITSRTACRRAGVDRVDEPVGMGTTQ